MVTIRGIIFGMTEWFIAKTSTPNGYRRWGVFASVDNELWIIYDCKVYLEAKRCLKECKEQGLVPERHGLSWLEDYGAFGWKLGWSLYE